MLGIALAFSSCNVDDPVDVNRGDAIAFNPTLMTRGDTITTSNLKFIDVVALKGTETYFEELKFSRTSGNTYDSEISYYWPGDDSQLDFYAFSPSSTELGGTWTINGTEQKVAGFAPASTIGAQRDFVYAHASGKMSENASSGVPLDMKHILSMIDVQAMSNSEAYTVKVDSVKIVNVAGKADIVFGGVEEAPVITPDADTKATYSDACNSVLTLNSTYQDLMNKANGDAVLVPQTLTAWDVTSVANAQSSTGSYLAIRIDVDTKDGANVYPTESGKYGWACVPIDTKWEQGKKYIYKLDLSDGVGRFPQTDSNAGKLILSNPIRFTLEVVDWEDKKVKLPEKLGYVTISTASSNHTENIFYSSWWSIYSSKVERMKVDGTEVIPSQTYTFAESGDHKVEIVFNPSITSFQDCFRETNIKSVSSDLFANLDILSFDNCFKNCVNLTYIPEVLFSDAHAATSFGSCFEGCTSLASIPENLFVNNTSVENFNSCFKDCTSLSSIPSSLFANNNVGTTAIYFKSCFYNCINLTGTTPVNSDGKKLWELVSYAFNGLSCFYGCTKLSDYSEMKAIWKMQSH